MMKQLRQGEPEEAGTLRDDAASLGVPEGAEDDQGRNLEQHEAAVRGAEHLVEGPQPYGCVDEPRNADDHEGPDALAAENRTIAGIQTLAAAKRHPTERYEPADPQGHADDVQEQARRGEVVRAR